jgi:hypothetical protein
VFFPLLELAASPDLLRALFLDQRQVLERSVR